MNVNMLSNRISIVSISTVIISFISIVIVAVKSLKRMKRMQEEIQFRMAKNLNNAKNNNNYYSLNAANYNLNLIDLITIANEEYCVMSYDFEQADMICIWI